MQAHHENLLVVVGPGRCGTLSIARMFRDQPDTVAYHERWRPVPYNGDLGFWTSALRYPPQWEPVRVPQGVERLTTHRLRVEVGFHWIPYVEWLLSEARDARCVILHRDPSEVIQSFLARHPTRNPWSQKLGPDDTTTPMDCAFPKFNGDRATACAAYVQHCYNKCAHLRTRFPDRTLEFRTEWLNVEAMVATLFQFARVDRPDLSVVGTHLNKRP